MLATACAADSAIAAPPVPLSDSSWRWTGCAASYAQHLSARSDAGGDVKDDSFACARSSGRQTQTFELGVLADTPPVGARNPVWADGHIASVTGHPSNQRDTFAAYVGFGTSYAYGLDAEMGYNVRAGFLNGIATDTVRGFIDAEHRAEGKVFLRHSPLSGAGRPLLQATIFDEAPLLSSEFGFAKAKLSGLAAATVGTLTDSITAGLLATIGRDSDRAPIPQNVPGLPARMSPGPCLYAGVFLQTTVYDLPSEDAGTRPLLAYAKVGGGISLTKKLSAQIEYTRPLTDRVSGQTVRGYGYAGVILGYRL